MGHSRPQTQLEAAARALEFSWTVEPSHHVPCSLETEATIQPKTEVDDDDCEIICEMPRPSKASRLTCENEMEAAGDVKSEVEGALHIPDYSWNVGRRSNSEDPAASISEEESESRRFAWRRSLELIGNTLKLILDFVQSTSRHDTWCGNHIWPSFNEASSARRIEKYTISSFQVLTPAFCQIKMTVVVCDSKRKFFKKCILT